MDEEFSFGRWMQRRRKSLDFTQEELADRVGCSEQTIRKIESDSRRPSKEMAARIAACLDIPPDEQAAFVRFARGESSATLTAPHPPHLIWRQPADDPAAQHDGAIVAEAQPDTAAPPVDRNRSRMLKKVRDFWIGGVLEHTLHGAALIALGLESQPAAVTTPWTLALQDGDEAPRSLPPGTRITDVFDALNGELLLLGQPGAGKTTLLLDLARDLLDRADRDVTHPVPVVFNLSSWALRRRPLAAWLVDELNERYDVPRRIGADWIARDEVLPLLDGLDEVAPAQRESCVQAINAFRQDHGFLDLAVCCRAEHYESLGTRLKLQGAVLIQPLESSQIDAYLAEAGAPAGGLRAALQQDTTLRDLASSPLLLNIMLLAYRDLPAEALTASDDAAAHRRRLFDAYVERALHRRVSDSGYTPEQIVRWLRWLAQGMQRQAQSVFLIERLQPDWIEDSRARRWYALDGVVVTLGLGILFGSSLGLAHGTFGSVDVLDITFIEVLWAWFLGGLWSAIVTTALGLYGLPLALHAENSMARGLGTIRWGLAGGIIAGFASAHVLAFSDAVSNGALTFALTTLLFGLVDDPWRVRIRQKLSWSWWRALGGGLVGLLCGIIYVIVVSAFSVPSPTSAVHAPAEWTLPMAVIWGSLAGLSSRTIEGELRPNQGIRRAGYHAVIIGGICGIIIGTILWIPSGWRVGSTAIIGIGALIGLAAGGLAWIRHYILRLILWRHDYLPWNIARFLDSCADRVLLRKLGGGYIFVHRLLLEHFAADTGSEASRESAQAAAVAARHPA
jgi:eukaryotic-like serine/threonine-protein kinase